MKDRLLVVISVAVSIGALWWCFHKVDLTAFKSEIDKVPMWVPWVAGFLYLLGFIPRAFRWRTMLSSIDDVSTVLCGETVILGYAANNLLPLRLGELVRAYVMGRKSDISRLTCLSSVGAERILDGLVIAGILGATTALLISGGVSILGNNVYQVLKVGVALFVGATGCLVAVAFLSGRILTVSQKLLRPALHKFLGNMLRSLEFLRSPVTALVVLGLSILIWSMEGFMFALLLYHMGISQPWLVGYFTLAVINLGILIPAAPGYVGVFQAFGVLAFTSIGLDKTSGLAFSIILHLCQYLTVTTVGIALFSIMGLTWKDVSAIRTSGAQSNG